MNNHLSPTTFLVYDGDYPFSYVGGVEAKTPSQAIRVARTVYKIQHPVVQSVDGAYEARLEAMCEKQS